VHRCLRLSRITVETRPPSEDSWLFSVAETLEVDPLAVSHQAGTSCLSRKWGTSIGSIPEENLAGWEIALTLAGLLLFSP
jgi:hypothetical protein